MNKILAIHQADCQAVVKPGTGWLELNERLYAAGIPLFLPVDPAPGEQVFDCQRRRQNVTNLQWVQGRCSEV